MTTNCAETPRKSFLATLEEQRWDDHRYYHQSRINQTLHLSARCASSAAYVIVWFRSGARGVRRVGAGHGHAPIGPLLLRAAAATTS
jgi:hypothetical protein